MLDRQWLLCYLDGSMAVSRAIINDDSSLLDGLALLWEYALPAVIAYDKAPEVSLGITRTGRVLFGRLSPGHWSVLDEKASSHNYLIVEVCPRHGRQVSRTTRILLDGVIMTMSAPLLGCQFEHSLCCCPSSEDGSPVAAYCISYRVKRLTGV